MDPEMVELMGGVVDEILARLDRIEQHLGLVAKPEQDKHVRLSAEAHYVHHNL